MKRLIVGGNFGNPKKSSVVQKIGNALYADIYNGGTLENLKDAINSVPDYDIVVWMPNADNEVQQILKSLF